MIEDPEIKEYLLKASILLEKKSFDVYECLLSISKAFLVAFEKDYCIEKYSDENPSPFEIQNKEWIQKNVKEVF